MTRIACPKCKEEGRDSTNNHLKPYDNGKGGCDSARKKWRHIDRNGILKQKSEVPQM